MIIIPAIDILNGECVRLFQGNYNNVTVYSKEPDEVARSFEKQGATRIHVVDLDGAINKGKNNRDKIAEIRKSISCTIEVGGGIRSEKDIEELIDIGINKLILGTIFARDILKVEKWISKYGSCFVAGIDALNGKVKITGWENDTGLDDILLAQRAVDIGINEIIYTNILNDGTLTGPDIERTNFIAEKTKASIILSGGVSSQEDVKKISQLHHSSVTGIIIGKAIYEQKVSVKDLIELFQNK